MSMRPRHSTHSSSRPAVRAWTAAALAVAMAWGGSAMARDLVVALKTEPTSMDPQYHALTPNIQLSQTLFESLVVSDENLAIKPGLAESWKADGNTWTFKLRPNVKFSDGSPFTAEDLSLIHI